MPDGRGSEDRVEGAALDDPDRCRGDRRCFREAYAGALRQLPLGPAAILAVQGARHCIGAFSTTASSTSTLPRFRPPKASCFFVGIDRTSKFDVTRPVGKTDRKTAGGALAAHPRGRAVSGPYHSHPRWHFAFRAADMICEGEDLPAIRPRIMVERHCTPPDDARSPLDQRTGG